jgi:hypothetical protein
MKYWQLRSVVRNVEPFRSVAESNRDWQEFLIWLKNEASIVQSQDRAKLDYQLPDLFVKTVLAQSDLTCYVSHDGWLRSYKTSPEDEVVTVLDAFNRFGADKLEEAWEKGCVDISDDLPQPKNLQ